MYQRDKDQVDYTKCKCVDDSLWPKYTGDKKFADDFWIPHYRYGGNHAKVCQDTCTASMGFNCAKVSQEGKKFRCCENQTQKVKSINDCAYMPKTGTKKEFTTTDQCSQHCKALKVFDQKNPATSKIYTCKGKVKP